MASPANKAEKVQWKGQVTFFKSTFEAIEKHYMKKYKVGFSVALKEALRQFGLALEAGQTSPNPYPFPEGSKPPTPNVWTGFKRGGWDN